LKVEGGQSQAAPRLLLPCLSFQKEEEDRKKHASSSSSSSSASKTVKQ
jgi:hypothetical protein